MTISKVHIAIIGIFLSIGLGSVALLSNDTITTKQSVNKSENKEVQVSVIPTSDIQQKVITPQPTATPTLTPTSTLKPTVSAINTSGNSSSVKLDNISPSSAANNQAITLRGSGFGSEKGYVIFYNSQGMTSGSPSIDSWSDSEIRTKVTFVKGGTFYLSVRKPTNEESNKVQFVVTAGQPYIEKINGAFYGPYTAKRNSQVTLTGSELGSSGSIEIQPNGVNLKGTVVSWSDSQVIFSLPSDLLTGDFDIILKTSDGRSASSKYLQVAD